MADEPQVVESEITLDDFKADEQPPAKAEPTPAPKETQPEVPEEKVEADTKEEPEEVVPEEKPEAESEAEAEKPLAPKSENRFQKLANENRELREKIEKLTSDTYAPKTVSELTNTVNPETGQTYTVAEAADVALDEQLRMRDYNSRATQAQIVVGTQALEIMQELPIFNPDSKQYDEELSGIAAETLEANLIRDPNIPEMDRDGKPTGRGMVVDYRQSPKQIYQTIARASGVSAAKGQIEGQKATEQMLANAEAPASAPKPQEKVDPLIALWRQED